MAETPSNMMPLGTIAPDFALVDTISGNKMTLDSLKSNIATVVMFICNHCPYVKHIQSEVAQTAREYGAKGISFIAISANDAEDYPADSPKKMREEALAHQYSFPYLYDQTQDVAKAYQAACTPDFYVFDKHMKCVYRGRFDNSTPGNGAVVTGKDLKDALDSILDDKPVSDSQQPSLGCNIKWKKK